MGSSASAKFTRRFGPYVVDLRAGELAKGGKKKRVQQQPMQVLAALLERPGEVVTREELREKIWPADTFVDFDHSLNTAIKKLREALGDNPERPKYIETLPRRGYRFLQEVQESEEIPPARSPAASRLAGKVFTLQAGEEVQCVVAPMDAKCFEEWRRLLELQDDVGVSMMIAEKRLLLVEAGKRVRLLSAEGPRGWCEVRILDGEHYGKTALVPRDSLRRTEE
jgi:DNA-binding winged helix-turn-helix (wHTH) protein